MKTSKLEDFKHFVWDPQTKKCLGRTRDSWAKLIAFYIALYTCLAAIWSIYFYIFHLTISDKYPKWQLEESLIGTNPGLGMRPQSPRQRVESALISYKMDDQDYNHWVEDLNEFIGQTGDTTSDSNAQVRQDCSANRNSDNNNNNNNNDASSSSSTPPPPQEGFCPFDNSTIPPECSAAQNYSFPLGKPCILIKLNRSEFPIRLSSLIDCCPMKPAQIYGWKPEPYESAPAKFPKEATFAPGNIQITCEGQHDPDKEHIGPVDYFPKGGIDTKYYPFLNQPGYQSPYVMVHFKDPKLDTLIYIECKAWAKNIEHDRYNKKGMTSFELFIERPTPAASDSSKGAETESR